MSIDIVFHIIGVLIVWDLLVTWFSSSLPAVLTRALWKTGWKRQDSTFWPPDIEDPMAWTKTRWEVWINLRFPTLGELATCPICLSRHFGYVVCIALWLCTGVGPINLLGALFWPVIATRLLKHL